MSVLALLLAIVAVAIATACAVADGALVAIDDAASGARLDGGVLRRRESLRRILALARLLGHLFSGALVAIAFAYAERPAPVGIIAALLAAVIGATVAESLGRSAGELSGSRALTSAGPIVRPLAIIFGPVVATLARLDRTLRHVIPPVDSNRVAETAARFARVVTPRSVPATSRTSGPLLPAPSVFSLADIEVEDVMVPRVDVIGLERDTPLSELVDRVKSSEHSRLPVYVETLDEVIGILFVKDLLRALVDDAPPEDWTSLLRPASFIPTTKSLDEQLRDFQTTRARIAIVVDEYGGTAGLLTLEDILEEIVGEIRDEYDLEEPELEQEEGKRYWVPGRLTLEELSEMLDHEFEHDEVSTVGGLIYNLLGRVPKAGESLSIAGFRVVVEQVTRRRVKRVYFERLESVVSGEAR